MIRQLDIGTADYVNGVFAQRKLAELILKNVYPGIIENKGKGVTDKFSTAPQVLASGQIAVNKVKPLPFKPRHLGKPKNGGAFSNAAAGTSETETVYIDTLNVCDDTFIVPMATQAMIPTDLLAEHTNDWSNRFNNILNGILTAKKFFTTYEAQQKGIVINHAAFDPSSADWLINLMQIHANMNTYGDPAHAIYSFPDEGLIFAIKGQYTPFLLQKGILSIGGANKGYDILKSGAFDAESTPDKMGSGFMGYIDGIETHKFSALPLSFADGFLGFPDGTLMASKWLGYCSSDVANSRGVAMQDNFKIVDTRGGQGIEVQPFAKMGAESWYPLGNGMIEATGFVNPYVWLSNASRWATGVTWQVLGEGSRCFPAGSIGAIATTGFTATFTALDDAAVDHINSLLVYFQADAAVTNLADFIVGYEAATVKGTATNGVAKGSITLTSTKYLNVLAVADDGSLTIASRVL